VSSVRRATPTTRIVRLALGGQAFPYLPGQVAMLAAADGAQESPYSIASAPIESEREGYLEFLTRIGSESLLGTVRRGARLKVSGPFGSFVLPERPAERSFLFVAGGTGIAPLRSMIQQAVLCRYPGRLRLLYSARTPADFAYLPELRSLARSNRLDLALTTTRELSQPWRGDRGRITAERLAPLIDTPDTLCFVCGPAAMVDDVPRMLRAMGIEQKRIRIEEWS
jgi:ferredoxin-NADP reductase